MCINNVTVEFLRPLDSLMDSSILPYFEGKLLIGDMVL